MKDVFEIIAVETMEDYRELTMAANRHRAFNNMHTYDEDSPYPHGMMLSASQRVINSILNDLENAGVLYQTTYKRY